MRIDLSIPGFEGSEVYVEHSAFSGAKLFQNGSPAQPASVRGQYLLVRDNGATATAQFKGFFLDPATRIEVDGVPYDLLDPLAWYQWVWSGLPILMLVGGGALGGLFGGMAVYFNTRLMRSHLPGIFRYGLSAMSSGLAFALYMSLLVAISPKARHDFAEGWKKGLEEGRGSQTSASSSSKPGDDAKDDSPSTGPGKFLVEVDNDFGEPVGFAIDGKERAPIAAYGIEAFEAKPGKHKFTFSRGGAPLDPIEAELHERKVTVLHPGGPGKYSLGTYTYTTGGPFTAAGPSFAAVDNAAVESDFGLTHAVPSQVVLKTGPHIGPQRFEVKSEPRSKLRKVVDENESIPVPRALAAIRRPAAYNDSALKAFTQALGKAPPSPEIQAALIAAATSNEEALVGPALVALKTYADQLPNDLLTQWLNGKNSALSQTAVRFLMRRDDGAILRTYFDRLPMDSQKQVLRALTDGVPITDLPSARLRKDLVVSALKRWPEKDSSETYYLLNFKGEDIDDAFNQDIEKFIAGFKEPNHRQLWNNTWARRVCTEADSIQGGWVDDRLVAWLKAPPEGVSHDLSVDAGKALVKRNKADKLAPAFASMTPHDRSLLMNLIYLDCVAKKSAPDSLAPFALEALKDSEPGVRRFAFLTLNDFASNQPGVSTALRDALAAETVADVKQDMDRKLTASATAAMNAASANASASANPNATVNNSAIASGGTEPVTGTGNVDMQPFDFAFSGPTQSIVAKAMDGLLFNTKRADNLAQLGEGLAKANAANRAWILLELGRFERFRSEPNFSIAYENVVAQGLIDPDAATRAAAVRAKVATLPLFVSSSLDYAELGIADAARQQELNLEVQRAWAERYADMNRRGGSDHTIRKTTQQKLLELASSPDEPTATAALNGLEVAYDADTVPKLIQIFQTGGSRAKKARILAVTGVNNDEALDMVLPIYSAGLGDADLEVRKATFEHLQHWCSSSTRRPKAFLAVKTAAAAETDPALKKQLEDWMKFAAR